ncbi:MULTISPECIES: ATP-binding protein [Stenotrophomonas]|jgi:predicted AAA+ superfamily ATPase|uniref:ATP-binding protein n=1 Tax=Stenotrophomonas maltophilia TaxID=40324 RepID=A0ABD7C1M4_STEMA|nr:MULTISPECIES: ATP-binding protein [Stenotrophomonas]QQQ40897.1 ATP-binding protein [Stenotrophomonas maltophilia]
MLEIAKEDVVARMRFDNPWWSDKQPDIPFSISPRRRYFPTFLEKIRNTKVKRAVILMGPRRVGKTVMVYQAINELLSSGVEGGRVLYLSLETPIYTGFSLESLLRMFIDDQGVGRREVAYIFFDEIQYLKDWEVHLKSLVDSFPEYRFVATGSAAAALRLKSQESGAGRFSNYVLPPLTFAEYLSFIGKENSLIKVEKDEDSKKSSYRATNIDALNAEFVNYLNYGGYPEAVIVEDIRDNPEQYIKSDIIDKVLLRDLPSLYGISDIQELNKLFNTLAYNTGNEVNLEGLSKSSGVAKNTIKRYLEYLEAAFLIRRVDRIDCSARQFKRATHFKVYLTNPSMRAALFGRIGPDDQHFGHIVETAIYSQWQHSDKTDLYYARWASGEIDIVSIDQSSQKPLWAVEVKWTDKPLHSVGELKNCVEFLEKNSNIGDQDMLVTSRTEYGFVKFGGYDFRFVPSAAYAYTLGANLLRAHRWQDQLDF